MIFCILASPVPVPGRASQGCSSESPTPPRCVSASPLSGKAEYSTPPSKVTHAVSVQFLVILNVQVLACQGCTYQGSYSNNNIDLFYIKY